MPITSDGKEPDLRPFLAEIQTAIGKVVRKAHRPNAGSGKSKDITISTPSLPAAATVNCFNAKQPHIIDIA